MRDLDRRAFLRALSRAGAAGAMMATLPSWARAAAEKAAAAELIERNQWPEHWETTLEALGRSWITRNDRFFVRSHFPVPNVDRESYRLEISGLVRRPASLTLTEIQELPRIEEVHTLECAGNGRGLFKLASTSGTQWERGAVGNAAWGGTKLSFLLQRAEVLPEAKHVWLEAADHAPLPQVPPFLRSLPISKAQSDVLLATHMNGQPLLRVHGAPLRAIVPGWFGMASTKWVTRIRVEAAPSDNHFMARGYRYLVPGQDPKLAPPVEEMKIKSLITRPLEGQRVPRGKVRVQGFAWAGSGGVRVVEVSSDRGKTWKPAGFMGETAPLAWRAWATELDVRSPSRVTVMARATDGRGEVQPLEAATNPAGYANNSIHAVSFRVTA